MPIHSHYPRPLPSAGGTISIRTLLTVVLLVLGMHLLVLAEVASAASISQSSAVVRAVKTSPKPAVKVSAKSSSSKSSATRYDFALDSKDWQKNWNFQAPKGAKDIAGFTPYYKDFSRVEWNADQGKFPGFLRVRIPKGGVSFFSSETYGKTRAGVMATALGSIAPADKLTLTYYVRFPKDFDFTITGALPCLTGGNTETNGKNASPFYACVLWDKEGKIGVYGNYKESTPSTGVSTAFSVAADDAWHKIDLSVTLNTIPSRRMDGTITAFYDGKEIFKRDTVQFRMRDTDRLDAIKLLVEIGGSSPIIAAKKDTYVDLAGFSVSATTLP